MSAQTMKRLISFKFTGVKVVDLVQFECDNKFKHAVTGRVFIVEGPKDIKELN